MTDIALGPRTRSLRRLARQPTALLGIVQALAYGVYARDKAAFKDRIRAFKLK